MQIILLWLFACAVRLNISFNMSAYYHLFFYFEGRGEMEKFQLLLVAILLCMVVTGKFKQTFS
jgi:hypothetical protein